MNFEEYHQTTHETAMYPGAGIGDWRALAYTSLGLAGEAGEVANQVKKIFRDDADRMTAARRTRIGDELGDLFWYLSLFMREAGIELSEVLEHNRAKLLKRQAEGTLQGDGEERVPVGHPLEPLVFEYEVVLTPDRGTYLGQEITRTFYAENRSSVIAYVMTNYGHGAIIHEVQRKGE